MPETSTIGHNYPISDVRDGMSQITQIMSHLGRPDQGIYPISRLDIQEWTIMSNCTYAPSLVNLDLLLAVFQQLLKF